MFYVQLNLVKTKEMRRRIFSRRKAFIVGMRRTSLALFEVVRGGALSRQPAMVLITIKRKITIMTISSTRSSEMNKAPVIKPPS